MTDALAVDWLACEARGLCAELLPERISLDEWGYPLVASTPISGEVLRHARRAAASCPVRALKIRRT